MDATLEAVVREGRGKNEANRLRVTGKIPAVMYGQPVGGAAPIATSLAIDPKELSRILHSNSGANTLISLKLANVEKCVMVREYQLDPVTSALLHADFYALAMDRVITVTVPVQLAGESPGVKLEGGVVDFVTHQVSVECLPTQIPAYVTVDISELMLSQSVRVRDLPVNATWKAVSEPETMLVHVVKAKAAAAATPDAGATVSEVAKKDKEAEAGKEKK